MKPVLPLAFLVLAACPGEKTVDEGPHCEDTRTAITLDEVTALGFSAASVLESVPVEESTTFHYVDGSSTALTLGFTPGDTAWFVDSEAVYPEGGITTDIAVICEDRIEIDGSFAFATEDGAFAESFSAPVSAGEEGIRLSVELDLENLTGTFDLVPFVTAEDWDELGAWIDVSFLDGVSSGSVSGQANGEDECEDGDECTAWSEAVNVGTWPDAME